VDFLLVLTELFSLGVTAEVLRANISTEIRRFRSNRVSLAQNFR